MGEMIATDLRAGNLVLHNKQIFEIYDIISTQDSVIIGQGDDTGGLQEVFISEIEPIQLTEKILLKCGFEYSKALGIYGLKESNTIFECDIGTDDEEANYLIHLYHDGNYLIVESTNDFGEYSNLNFRHIKHLHQLQNLYFSLTGQELYVTNLIN